MASTQQAVADVPNPLAAGLERLPVAPTTLVIFGATGDLARRKLLPALYNLAHDGALPDRFHLVGVARREKTHEDFREECEEAIREFSRRAPHKDVLRGLLQEVRYVAGTFDDESVYSTIESTLQEFDEQAGEQLARVYYLSTAPSFFPVIVEALGTQGLSHAEDAPVRVVIEKPFGSSLEEARELNRRVLAVFDESQVFRIDHYLGKETVQNMLALRFANGLFEPLWNRNYIDYVQITAAEDIGIGSRAGYYDKAGALRDLIQNHMLQLLCHVAMEPPVAFNAEEVRNEKVKVLRAIQKPTTRGHWADVGARSVHERPHRRRRRSGLPRRGGSAAEVDDGDLRRAAAGGRQLALGGRSVLLARGQALGAEGDGDRGDAEAGAAPRVLPGRLAWRAPEPARADGAAERRRLAAARGEDPGHAHEH